MLVSCFLAHEPNKHAPTSGTWQQLFPLPGISPSGSSVHGILQARILEWVTMPFSRGPSRSRDGTDLSSVCCTGKRVLYHEHRLASPHWGVACIFHSHRLTSLPEVLLEIAGT
ncbi:hypothetical protein R6Z07F_009872 [Ovis aries]